MAKTSNAVQAVTSNTNPRPGSYQRLANVQHTDSWQNVVTGLGTLSRDKRMSSAFEETPRLVDQQLENLYHGDDMAARACDALPEEMLRQGFSVKVEADDDDPDETPPPGDPDKREPAPQGLEVDEAMQIGSDVTMAMMDLDAVTQFMDAIVWSNVFGGSILLPGINDGTPPERAMEPLRENSIQSVDFLNVIDKRHMTPIKWYTNPLEPKFGRPQTYLITPDVVHGAGPTAQLSAIGQVGAIEIHETRLIVFEGTRVTNRRRQRNNGFADSVLQRMHDVLRDFNQSFDGMAHVMADFAQGVFKIKGLIDMLAAGDDETIMKRFQIMDLSRSVARAIALDAELEEFDRSTVDLGGVPQVLDKMMIRLAAAARQPVTVLMGQSPAGMDATGESDRQIWFDVVRARTQFELIPALRRLAELIMLSRRGPTGGIVPQNWRIHVPDPWTLTPKEESEQRLAQSAQDKNYVDSGVVLPEEIALSRFPADGYSVDTTVDLALRKEVLEAEKQAALEAAGDPDPLPPTPGDPDPDPDREDAGHLAAEKRKRKKKRRKGRKDGHLARKHVHAFVVDGVEHFTSADGENEDHTHTGTVDGVVINFSRQETGVPHSHVGLVSGAPITTGGSEDPGVAVDDQD